MVCLQEGSSLEELNAPFLNGVIRSGIKFIRDRQMKISEATDSCTKNRITQSFSTLCFTLLTSGGQKY